MSKRIVSLCGALLLALLPLGGLCEGALPQADIFVTPVENLADDFLLGADVSTLLAEENSGVVYYDEAGQPADLLRVLKDAGLNSVRLRVWVDPFDELGRCYGGGVCDLQTAIAIGKRCADVGLSVAIDFHYSDFWADPGKQMAPKAWKDMDITQKCDALYQYTLDSLAALKAAGVPVTLVQVGNETNGKMCGETKFREICPLMSAGAKAVREVYPEAKVAVHFANPEAGENYAKWAGYLQRYKVDYDVFASSYYPYWHGTWENLKTVLSGIQRDFGKQVMIAEISYAYTYEDGDHFGNTIGEGTVAEFTYPVSVQGQANCIRDAVAAMAEIGGIGVFYWEPAWLPVPAQSDEERVYKWETYGSGWASSASVEYDPDDAGLYYGGSAWDNQALFDFEGHPLASLTVYRYLRSGATTTRRLEQVESAAVTVREGQAIALPDAVTAVYNDGTTEALPVQWDTSTLPEAPAIGEYVVQGHVDEGGVTSDPTCAVSVVAPNFLENSGFEADDDVPWVLTDVSGTTDELYVIDRKQDAVSGNKSLHFYSTRPIDFTCAQTVENLPAGLYDVSLTLHGGDAANQSILLTVECDGETYTQSAAVTKWREMQTPVIAGVSCQSGTMTVSVRVACDAGGWGNLDDFALTPHQ